MRTKIIYCSQCTFADRQEVRQQHALSLTIARLPAGLRVAPAVAADKPPFTRGSNVGPATKAFAPTSISAHATAHVRDTHIAAVSSRVGRCAKPDNKGATCEE